jgi:lysophospholipase L1-like esterase
VLIDMIQTITANNPYGHVLVLNYWTGVVSPFAARTWAAGYTPQEVTTYNRAIRDSCEGAGLGGFPQVACVDAEGWFSDMGDAHVIRYTGRDELYALMTEPPKDNSRLLLEAFFNVNPGGQILGDGVHLSPTGKRRLAENVVTIIQRLPPLAGSLTTPTPAPGD